MARISRRTWAAWAICGAGFLVAGANSPAQETTKAAAQAQQALPLGKVVMFNSGVGYFEHRGNVEGNTTVDLRFRIDEINDLLKSMILEDRGGGTISTVTYGSRDPITKTLKTFPVDLTANPTLGQILSQVRGERVQIDAPTAITGVLVGVEKRKKEIGKDHETIEAEYLNLLTDSGLRSIPLDSVGSMKLLNEKLDAELRQALAVLAAGHNTDKKTVTLNLAGNGKRPVRVGYIQAMPVWKTSYRLVLDDKNPPFLQGWAIVENTTEGDWDNVSLTLVSGRPISYTMDLYEPLYAQRPVETLNLFSSLRPQTYGQDMDKADEAFRRQASDQSRGVDRYSRDNRNGGRFGAGMGGMGGGVAAKAMPASPAPAQQVAAELRAEGDGPTVTPSLNLNLSGQSAAHAGDVGELFRYVISTPVTLARQKSAMLPIVNESIKGDKVSIYNEAVDAKHPLNGFRLINSTDLHLMQGPITVFDGNAYAGDAKIEDLAPKAERLISYAMDLKTEVAPETKGHPEQLLSVKLNKGTLLTTRKNVRERKFTIKNSDSKPKTVLVEYPLDANWKLVKPEKPSEKTRDKYRFAVTAEPGKPTTLVVEEEQPIHQSLVLSDIPIGLIEFYISQKEVSPAVKAALAEVVKRKQALEQAAMQRQQLDQQIGAITQEQDRIRQNMGQLDRTTDLYKRYVQKFGTQEDSVEQMREKIQKLTAEETRQRKSLDDYLINLDI